jgi:hypothetical protein
MRRTYICLVLAAFFVPLACKRAPAKAHKQNSPSAPSPFYSAAHIVPNGSAVAAPLAPGRIASIYGTDLGPAQPCHGTADPNVRETPNPLRPNQTLIETQVFPTHLCDTEVHVGGAPAGLLYVSSGQINFRVPQSVSTQGTAEVRVVYKGQRGPAVSVPLTVDAPARTPEQVAASMWSSLQHVEWQRPYRPRKHGCSAVRVQPAGPRGGLHGHAYYCAEANDDVTVESFYYPVDPANPQVLLLRADIRPVTTYPEWSVEVEQHLARRLTRAFGAGTAPENVYEIGASPRQPGLSWRNGNLTLFLHHNRNHVSPAGIRQGVILVAVRNEILAQRHLQQGEPLLETKQLEALLPGLYFPDTGHPPRSEAEREAMDSRTRAALLRLLRRSDGEPDGRAAALVAADDLAVRLGRLLVARTVQRGSEFLTLVADAENIRAQLAKHGIRYGDIGHYSGDLEYDRSLLHRAWTEYPDTLWGQRAFLMLQRLGCTDSPFRCPGPNCFLAVIRQGEEFLNQYPDSRFRSEQIYHLALAHDTWWSLGQAESGDITAMGARVTRASAERARLRAIDLYEQLLRIAPGTSKARAAEIALPRLKLKLDTGERTFFCYSC